MKKLKRKGGDIFLGEEIMEYILSNQKYGMSVNSNYSILTFVIDDINRSSFLPYNKIHGIRIYLK